MNITSRQVVLFLLLTLLLIIHVDLSHKSGGGMKKVLIRFASVLAIVVLSVAFIARDVNVFATVPGINTIVSDDGAGNQSNGHVSTAKISKFGERVAFSSAATNLVAGDTNGKKDVFVRDIETSTVTRISVSSSGVESDGVSELTAFSSTGRFVAFHSDATNLIDGQSFSATRHNYLHDSETGETFFISNNGNQGYMSIDDISEDGRFILVNSAGGGNILPGQVSGSAWHVFILDRSDNTWRLVNVPYGGGPQNGSSNGKNSDQASMSCDGSFVVFRSQQSNLTQNDTNGWRDVFLADMRNGVKIINLTEFTDHENSVPNISCDGRYIVFLSESKNFVSGIPSWHRNHAYRYDRLTGNYDLISQSTNGALAHWDPSIQYPASISAPSVSDYGDVLFSSSNARNLIDGHYITGSKAYLRKVDEGVTETLSVINGVMTLSGVSISGGSDMLSADGNYVILQASNDNFVPGDTNGYHDIVLAETGL